MGFTESSGLIYLAFRLWLDCDSRALILDPTYGEYTQTLERRCDLQR